MNGVQFTFGKKLLARSGKLKRTEITNNTNQVTPHFRHRGVDAE